MVCYNYGAAIFSVDSLVLNTVAAKAKLKVSQHASWC